MEICLDIYTDELKVRLLECSGLTALKAGQMVFDPKELAIKGAAVKIVGNAATADEAIDRVTIHKTQSRMSTKGKQFIDGRNPSNLVELRSALQSWIATMGFLTPENAPKRTDIGGRSRFKCLKCGKAGQRAMSCRGDSAKTPSSAEKPVFTCFSCGQPGHKSVECPNQPREARC